MSVSNSNPMRPGEVDGQYYHFLSKDEFLSMVEREVDGGGNEGEVGFDGKGEERRNFF